MDILIMAGTAIATPFIIILVLKLRARSTRRKWDERIRKLKAQLMTERGNEAARELGELGAIGFSTIVREATEIDLGVVLDKTVEDIVIADRLWEDNHVPTSLKGEIDEKGQARKEAKRTSGYQLLLPAVREDKEK